MQLSDGKKIPANFYILENGVVCVSCPLEDHEVMIDVLKKGEYILNDACIINGYKEKKV